MKFKFLSFLTLLAFGSHLFAMEQPEYKAENSVEKIAQAAYKLVDLYGNEHGFSTPQKELSIIISRDNKTSNNDQIKFTLPNKNQKVSNIHEQQLKDINNFIKTVNETFIEKIKELFQTDVTDGNLTLRHIELADEKYLLGKITNLTLPPYTPRISTTDIVEAACKLADRYGDEYGFSTSENLVSILFSRDKFKDKDQITFMLPKNGYSNFTVTTKSQIDGKVQTMKIVNIADDQINDINKLVTMVNTAWQQHTKDDESIENIIFADGKLTLKFNKFQNDYRGEVKNITLPAYNKAQPDINVVPVKKSSSILGKLRLLKK